MDGEGRRPWPSASFFLSPLFPWGAKCPPAPPARGSRALWPPISFFFGNFIEMSLCSACQLSLSLLNKGLLNGLIAPSVGSSL